MISDNSYSNTGLRSTSHSGKWKILILFLFLQFNFSSTAINYSSSKTFQKGGILFEDIGGAQVNGEYMTYKRIAETSKLEEGIRSGSDLAMIYNNLCTRVINSVRKAKENTKERPSDNLPKIDTIVSPIKYPIKEADRVCKNMNAKCPEIRNWSDHARLLTIMQNKNILDIKAGIKYHADLNHFKFISDDEPAEHKSVFANINYGGDWPNHESEANWHTDEWMKGQASKYFLSYQRRKEKFVLRLVSAVERNRIDYIVCERYHIPDISKDDIKHNMLYQIIAHNCARDMDAIMQQMAYSVNEARAITNLNLTIPHNNPDYKQFFPDMSEFETTFNLLQNDKHRRSLDETTSTEQISSHETSYNETSFNENSFNENSFNENSSNENNIKVNNRTKRSIFPFFYMPLAAQHIFNNITTRYSKRQHFCKHQSCHEYSKIHLGEDHQQLQRHKRAFPLIPIAIGLTAGTAAANVISSAVSGDAPLSWFGQSIAPILGLSTTKGDPDM